ncbi:hypothetical protein CALVIDRAFT_565094 [Calocera viscosa TUFC12733]|uniref:Uncharacterized protein n=1 Tax=Calocera viscosa (strain TUFC12733) TaxID=1330018 RepID=A0A167KT50_CALVF|nr:hypothetical protein CALVIDRAFT_565094 [Calocera viscosa TUFC12733]
MSRRAVGPKIIPVHRKENRRPDLFQDTSQTFSKADPAGNFNSIGSSTEPSNKDAHQDLDGSSFDVDPFGPNTIPPTLLPASDPQEELSMLYALLTKPIPGLNCDPMPYSSASNACLDPSTSETFDAKGYNWPYSSGLSPQGQAESLSNSVNNLWTGLSLDPSFLSPTDQTDPLLGLSYQTGQASSDQLAGFDPPPAPPPPPVNNKDGNDSTLGSGGSQNPNAPDRPPSEPPTPSRSRSADNAEEDDPDDDSDEDDDPNLMDAEERQVFDALQASTRGSSNSPDALDRRQRAFSLLSSYYHKIWPRAVGALPESSKMGRRVAKALVHAIVDITCERYGLGPDRLWKDIGGFSSLARTTNAWNLFQKRARTELALGEVYDPALTHRTYREQAAVNPDLQLELERWDIEHSLPKDDRLRSTERQELFDRMAASAKWLFSESEKKSQIGGRFQLVGLNPLDGGDMVMVWESEALRGMGESIFSLTIDGERIRARDWTTHKFAAITTCPPPDELVDPRAHEGTKTAGVREMKEAIKERGKVLLHDAIRLSQPNARAPSFNRWGPYIEEAMIQYQCTLVNWPRESPFPHDMQKDLQTTHHDDLRPVWIAYTTDVPTLRAEVRRWSKDAIRYPIDHNPPLIIRTDGSTWSYNEELARRNKLPPPARSSGGVSLRKESLRTVKLKRNLSLVNSTRSSPEAGEEAERRATVRKGKRRLSSADHERENVRPKRPHNGFAQSSTHGNDIANHSSHVACYPPPDPIGLLVQQSLRPEQNHNDNPQVAMTSTGSSLFIGQPLPPLRSVLPLQTGQPPSFQQSDPPERAAPPAPPRPSSAISPLHDLLIITDPPSSISRAMPDDHGLEDSQDLQEGWEERPECACGRRARKYVQRKGGPMHGEEMFLCHERNEWLNHKRDAERLEKALQDLPRAKRPANSWVQRANGRWGSGTLEKDPKALKPENKAPGCDFFLYKRDWIRKSFQGRSNVGASTSARIDPKPSLKPALKASNTAPVTKPVLKTIKQLKKESRERSRQKPYQRPEEHRPVYGSSHGPKQTCVQEHIAHVASQVPSSTQVEPSDSPNNQDLGGFDIGDLEGFDYMSNDEEDELAGLAHTSGSDQPAAPHEKRRVSFFAAPTQQPLATDDQSPPYNFNSAPRFDFSAWIERATGEFREEFERQVAMMSIPGLQPQHGSYRSGKDKGPASKGKGPYCG